MPWPTPGPQAIPVALEGSRPSRRSAVHQELSGPGAYCLWHALQPNKFVLWLNCFFIKKINQVHGLQPNIFVFIMVQLFLC